MIAQKACAIFRLKQSICPSPLSSRPSSSASPLYASQKEEARERRAWEAVGSFAGGSEAHSNGYAAVIDGCHKGAVAAVARQSAGDRRHALNAQPSPGAIPPDIDSLLDSLVMSLARQAAAAYITHEEPSS
jgi:hypothetical protein